MTVHSSSIPGDPRPQRAPSEDSLRALTVPVAKERRYLALQEAQIAAGGGRVSDGRFVTRPGQLVVSTSRLEEMGGALLDQLHIDRSVSDGLRLSEAFARQTYLAYPQETKSADEYLEKVVQQAGHRSVTKGTVVTNLLSGVSVDDAIKLIAEGGDIARVTTSKTRAMDATLYAVRGTAQEQEWQRERVARFLELRESLRIAFDPHALSENGREFFNMFNLSAKTIALFHTMNLKSLHSLFKRSLASKGKPPEQMTGFSDLCSRMADDLAQRYPGLVEPAATYARGTARRPDPQLFHAGDRTELLRRVELRGGSTSDGLFVTKAGVALTPDTYAFLDALPEGMPEVLVEQIPVEFGISGISYETVLELVSHDEASTPWLPDNTMLYLNDPAFRIQGTESEQRWQREGIERFLTLCADHPAPLERREFANSFSLGTRAVELNYVMSLANFNKLFIGRLSYHGNEQEIQEICASMAQTLHARFPGIIREPAGYYKMNNEAKY